MRIIARLQRGGDRRPRARRRPAALGRSWRIWACASACTARRSRRRRPLPSTELCWAAWEGLMANRHWLEGIVANTCAERVNVPGYGKGDFRKLGWFGLERAALGQALRAAGR